MATGLVALLDDMAAIAKLAAASLDDVGAAASKAGSKAVGVVVDDAAVTPRYVAGFSPERELPIIGKIALGSVRNKLLILLPACLLLSSFAPWAVNPLLMLGGAYLCFEGAEKLIEAVTGHHEVDEGDTNGDPAALEKEKISGAVRTDFILSAEIMAIALSTVADEPLLTRAVVLAAVGLAITVGVYGVVGLIVKMDDIGLNLSRRSVGAVRALGRGLVKGMPIVMSWLAIIGTAAMLWVGGGIIVHGLAGFHVTGPEHVIHGIAVHASEAVPPAAGAVAWIVTAALSGVVGLVLGGVIVALIHAIQKARGKHA